MWLELFLFEIFITKHNKIARLVYDSYMGLGSLIFDVDDDIADPDRNAEED